MVEAASFDSWLCTVATLTETQRRRAFDAMRQRKPPPAQNSRTQRRPPNRRPASAKTPIDGIHAGVDAAMERGMRPCRRVRDHPVPDRIDMNILHVARMIPVASDRRAVFPRRNCLGK